MKTMQIEPMESRRLLSAGQLDAFFGTNGLTPTPITGATIDVKDMAVMNDGRVVVAAAYTPTGDNVSRLLLARYAIDGKLDAKFGAGTATPGVIRTSFVLHDDVAKLALSDDGFAYVVTSDKLAKFKANGGIDKSFATGGVFSTGLLKAQTLDVDDLGRPIIGGLWRKDSHKSWEFALQRLIASGYHDQSFTSDGLVTPIGGPADGVLDIRARSSGAIQVMAYVGSTFETFLVKYSGAILDRNGMNSDGYGTRGWMWYSPPVVGDFTTHGASQLVGGVSFLWWDDTDGVHIIRFNAGGIPDYTFGSGGTVVLNGLPDHTTALTAMGDGSAVVVGAQLHPGGVNNDLAIGKVKKSAAIDKTFGTNGVTTIAVGSGNATGKAVALAADGSILVAGQTDGQGTLVLARYWRDDAPAVRLDSAPNIASAGGKSTTIGLSIRDDSAIDVSAIIDGGDFVVTSPGGKTLKPTLVTKLANKDVAQCSLLLSLAAPGGAWDSSDNGTYQVRVLSNHVFDTVGNVTGGRTLGSFVVRIT